MKRLRKSKTQWANLLLMGGLAFWPRGAQWVSEHPSQGIFVVCFANQLLRLITKDEIELSLPFMNGKK